MIKKIQSIRVALFAGVVFVISTAYSINALAQNARVELTPFGDQGGSSRQ